MHIILEAPYVSSILKEAVRSTDVSIIDNDFVRIQTGMEDCQHVDDVQPAETLFYSNSENALDWLTQQLPDSKVTERIQKLKNKTRFREIIRTLHPDFFFKETDLAELKSWESLPTDKTIIIKPTIGFLSLGVIKVNSQQQWGLKKQKLLKNLSKIADYYPKAVVDSNRFIIEEYLDGPEFAIDAYFDSAGKPVILNISEHLFASANDVNDRVYFTSKEVMQKHHDAFLNYLEKAGALLDLKNFPVHAEVRITSAHGIVPIEFNALRFGGWCTSGDVAYHAYGINIYAYYFEQKVPDWETILENMNDDIYSFVMLDNTSKVATSDIKTFDIKRLADGMECVLEQRAFDHHQYPIFGILLTRTSSSNMQELKKILTSDLSDFMIC